jgi:signal transduction histidine kinase
VTDGDVKDPAPAADTHTDPEWLVNQIAHALRGPIFAAMVQADTLERVAGDPQRALRSATMLREQLERLEASLEEMLLYGRPARLACRETDLGRLLDELHGVYRDTFGDGGGRLRLDHQLEGVTATLDPQAVDVILRRLVDNALRHSPEPADVEIAASAGDGRFVVEVRDRGEGMSDEVLRSSLLPFFPQHAGRPGLGLAVASKFAASLGGTVTVATRDGGGIVARVALPLSGPDAR